MKPFKQMKMYFEPKAAGASPAKEAAEAVTGGDAAANTTAT